MKLIFVTGLEDVDKQTIVDLALQRAGKKRDFEIIDFDKLGDTGELKEITDLEAIRHALSKFYGEVEKVMITRMKETTNLVVSGCLTFETVHGYLRALPDEFFTSFKPDNMVILEKETRDEKANEHQRINRYYGVVFSSLCGAALRIIRFREDRTLKAVEELSKVMKY